MEQRTSFDKNTVTAIVICIAILLGWQMYLERKYPAAMAPATSSTTAALRDQRALPQPVTSKAESAEVAQEIKNNIQDNVQPTGKEDVETYEDSSWKVAVSSFGGRVSEIILKKYTDAHGKAIELLTPQMPGYLLTDLTGGKTNPELSRLNYKIEHPTPTQFVLSANHNGVDIKKTLTVVPDDYMINTETVISGNLGSAQNVSVEVEQPTPSANQSSSGLLGMARRGADIQEYYFSHATKKSRDYVSAKEAAPKVYEQTEFAALGSRYFTSLLFNRGDVTPIGHALTDGPNSVLRLDYPIANAQSPVMLNYTLYAGPKALAALRKVDESARLVVDFGMFSWIAVPILKLMKLLYQLFRNYGVSIIVLTILMRLITYPFTYMSYKSMKSMQKIQPEIARLKEVYKSDQVRQNQEMMKLMRENKVNPMGGCLPMLLQLPVFWALYQVLQNSIELYHSPFVGWIHDLSMKDPYYILPVLMGATMFVQQKITPSTMDPAQARMMLIMPVVFSLLMFSLPAGLTLYIFVSTLFGIIQQMTMMKNQGGPPQAMMRKS